jgi:hypothetical protein
LFLPTLHRDDVWPYSEHVASWDEDSLFDVIEVLHDLCAKGVDGRFQSFNDCGMHYSSFNAAEGQLEYRGAMNPVLAQMSVPWELGSDSRLVDAGQGEFRPLLNAVVPIVPDGDLVDRRLDEAVRLLRGRSASTEDRRHAVRDLADVLAALRGTIKPEALPNDESELFRLANGFAIRHNNRERRRQYDDDIWLRWAFYVYLATIHATLRLQARQVREP